MNIPTDFKGHSLSVSDVVELNIQGKQTFNYVDSFGFQEIQKKSFSSQQDISQEVNNEFFQSEDISY